MTNLTHDASKTLSSLDALTSGSSDPKQLEVLLSTLAPLIRSPFGQALVRLFTDPSLILENGDLNTSSIDSILAAAVTPATTSAATVLVCPRCRCNIIVE